MEHDAKVAKVISEQVVTVGHQIMQGRMEEVCVESGMSFRGEGTYCERIKA